MGRLLMGSLAGAALAAAMVGTAVTAAPASATEAEASALTGNAWILATLTGKAPLEGTELTAVFTPKGRLSGSAGCNRYSGTYRTSQGRLRIAPLATTQMACAPPIERQERAFLKMLTSARRFSVRRGVLTLRSMGGRQLATFRAQTQALAGTSWEVLAYNNGKQAVVSTVADTKLTAVFGKDGRLTGFAGCNNYHASYEAKPPALDIGPVASTRRHCEKPVGVGKQEAQYLAALETVATYRIEGSQLELRTEDDALAVQLHRG